MDAMVLKFLDHRLEIYKSEKGLFFESYATEQAIELLKKQGTDVLLVSLDAGINSKGVHPTAKMFFMEFRNKINEIKFNI